MNLIRESKSPQISPAFIVRKHSEIVKHRKSLIFLKNGKNNKIVEMVQRSLKIFIDLG